MFDIETEWVRAVLKTEFSCEGGEVPAHQIESGEQPLLRGVVIDRTLKFFDFSAKLINLARKIAARRNSS